MKLFILALCIVAAVALDEEWKHCKTTADCDEDECCVSYLILHHFGKGVCKKYKQEGETCSMFKKNEEKMDVYPLMCPCKEGLTCQSTHEIVVFGRVIKFRPECGFSNYTATTEPEDFIGTKEAE